MNAETALATTNGAQLAPASSHPRALLTKQMLEVETEQRKLLQQYVASHMVEGTDYGKIPGTDKPTLLKPGAEKLVDLFRCTPKFALIKCEEDFEKGFFNYIFRVRITQRDSGAVLAEGFGSANSREGRYRWRNAQRKCPKCQKEAILLSKNPGEGFFCWAKRGGCGAKFPANDPAIIDQPLGKVENDDIATLANTILKMGKKRAYVDAAIALARCSDMFTQDVEDLVDHGAAEERPQAAEQPKQAQAAPPAPQPQPKPAPAKDKKPAAKASARSKEEVAAQALASRARSIWNRAKTAGSTPDEFSKWCGTVLGKQVSSAEWTKEDVDLLESCLPELLESKKGPV